MIRKKNEKKLEQSPTVTDKNIQVLKNFDEQEIFDTDVSLNKRIKFFSTLPYTKYPFSKRSWGDGWHTLCSYQSRLKASIAHYLVLTFTSPNQTILDPFSGVGTIPLEACLNGRIGTGLDINPVAYHTTL